MDGSIFLSAKERKVLLQAYRNGTHPRISRRAHVILLRCEGWTWQQIQAALFCSSDLIADSLRKFRTGRISAILEERQSSAPIPAWLEKVRQWITSHTPRDFGFFRSRWSCELLAHLLAWERGIRLSAETVRRGLKRLGFAWRRPRPVVGPTDPEHSRKLREIQALLADLPPDEVAVFQDEVDVHLNPKIGSMWMRRGEQAEVVTPGNNRKCHLAGSLVWQTGTLLVSPPEWRRNTALFVTHLEDLRRRLRGWKRIHVICDNAAFHKSRAVQEYLHSHGNRIELHYLPAYAPQTNPIERVWWHLHETITRNHRCRTLEELLDQAYEWFKEHNNFLIDMRRSFAKAA